MTEGGFVGDLLLLIALATAAAVLFERLRLPPVAGFLVIGALVGPDGFALVENDEQVRSLAEFGVVFLLFEIGLELPMDRVQKIWRRAAAAGALQVLVTVGLVAVLSMALGVAPTHALVLGGIVAMSSTALVIGVLASRGEVASPAGQLSLGILLFQDLCIVPFLLAVPLLANWGSAATGDALFSLLQSVAALVLFGVLARFGLPWLLDRVIARGSREVFTLVAFLVVLGSAWAAEEIGLTLAVGAFVGGLVLSSSPYAHQLFSEVVPMRGVLIGIFFTAVGMLLDPAIAIDGWSAVLTYVAFVVLVKSAIVAAVVALVLRQGWRLGIIAGLGLAQTGEFSFVLASAAADGGLLDETLHQVFLAGSILTLVATPLLIRVAPELARRIARSDESDGALDLGEPVLRDHAVLLGYGLGGQTIARVLRSRGVEVLGVDANAASVQKMRAVGESVMYGDVTRRALLERVAVANAKLVAVTLSDPIATREAVRLVRSMAPDVPVVARAHFLLEVDRLYEAGATAVVAEEFESTLEVVSRVLRLLGIPDSTVSQFTDELREEGYEPLRSPTRTLDPWLGELLDQESTQWLEVEADLPADATLERLGIRASTGCSILAIEHVDGRVANPLASEPIRRGDRVLGFGTTQQMEALGRLLRPSDGNSG